MVFSYLEVQDRLSIFLERALTEGQVKFRNRDGRVFVIRPERLPKASPFDIRSADLLLTKTDILEAIQESRARYG